MPREIKISDNTTIPIGWVFALLVGCASFSVAAVKAGEYIGGNDASAAAISMRVDKLEDAVKKIPEIAEGVARLEGAMGTKPDERKPANK